jgi:hypothetical protein
MRASPQGQIVGDTTAAQEATAQAIETLLDSSAFQRLVLICGAGLSIAAPSQLPTAARLASVCVENYREQRGIALPPPLDSDLEALADYFLDRTELLDTFILNLVPRDLTHASPNTGHYAVADFIATRSCQCVVSTNFDNLIELAVDSLGLHGYNSSLDGTDAERSARDSTPLLKIHGCWVKQREHTIWTPKQLLISNSVVCQRIRNSREWLTTKLQNKDLLFLGFFTDWQYLNSVLKACLPNEEPRFVTVVDPAESTH